MNDIQRIVRTLKERDEACCIATVVDTEGSTYRHAGARMLMFADGTMIGAISGGCLEKDVWERAQSVFADGQSKYVVYDALSDEQDRIFGFGMGCNGVTKVVIERFTGYEDAFVQFTAECLDTRQKGVVATLYEIEQNSPQTLPLLTGNRLMMTHDDRVLDNFGENTFAEQLREYVCECAVTLLEHERSHCTEFSTKDATARIFLEFVKPPQELVIFGAGYDVVPLVEYASLLGWRIIIADHRPAFLTKDRFPHANALHRIPQEELAVAISTMLDITPQTAVVVMTHKFETDKEILRYVLPQEPHYIGILGPKKRIKNLLEELHTEGFQPTKQQIERLHSPIGLDLGSEGAEAVALSVVAEIQAVLHGRKGGFLRERKEPLHSIEQIT